MATFGIYQVLDPLYVTPSGSVCSARIVGGEATGRIAAKVFNAPKSEPDEPNWEPKYFLDRAQVQRRVAASGGAHWAPVYALGFTPEGGAYYVTDYHALTAQKMIDGRVPVDAAALHAIVRSVVSGLEEVRRIAGRAHANLKPTNVLLVGKGPADELRAVLCDPGQAYKAEKEGEAGDLRALGALIHELVLNRPPGGTDFATPGEPAWAQRLGDKGEAWRQLCAELLTHPIPSRVATLSGVGKVVDGLAPSRLKVPHLRLPGGKPKKPGDAAAKPPRAKKVRVAGGGGGGGPSKFKRRLVQAAAVVLLLGGTVAVLGALESNAREEVCTARRAWLGSLATSLAEPQRRERYNADAHLRRIADNLDEVERAGVECPRDLDEPKFNPLGFLNVYKARTAAAALRRLEADLAPESWPQLAKLRDLARVFEQRGWQQPSGYVTRLLEGVRPTPIVSAALASRPSTGPDAAQPAAGSLALRIDRVLRLRPIIEQQAAAAYDDWKHLEERTAALAASPDPVIHGFGEFLRRDAAGGIKLTDEGFEGLNQLKIAANTAHQVLESLRTIPPTELDNARFDEQVASRINPGEPTMADVKHWLARRPEYVVQRDAIAQAVAALQKSYDDTRGEVAKSEPLKTEAAAFEQEQKGIEAAIRELRQTPFVKQDLADNRLAGKVVEIQRQIDNLRLYYHAENPADWVENLDRAGIATTSERVRGIWDSWVRTLRSDLEFMKGNRDLFTQNKTRTDQLRDVLSRVELEFPQPPEGLTEEFAQAARRHREEQIGKLLEGIRVTDPQVKPADLKLYADATAGWFKNLQALNKDFPIAKPVLTAEDKPDAAWRAPERASFWNDRAVQQLVRKDVERLELLRKLPRTPRESLAKLASDDNARDEVVLAAWQQLGKVGPAWPGGVEELEVERTLRGKIKARLAKMPAGDRKGFDEAFAAEGPRRWSQFVRAADREEMLVAALQRRAAFGVDSDVLAAMPAESRFNVWLCLANSAIRDGAAAAAAAAEAPGGAANRERASETFDMIVDNLEAAAKDLNDEARSSQVLEKLARLKAPEPFQNAELGEVFQYRPKGLADDPIEFRRVEPSDGSRPFYLATREVTFGQFVGAIDGEGRWDAARQLSWPYAPGKADPRRGARVWEWADAGDPRLVLPRERLWMTADRNPNKPEKHNDFPRDFHPEPEFRFNRNVISPQFGGLPSERHPMQYVTAQAAVYYAAAMGCRLPTAAEWRHALTAMGPSAKANWNLRDGTWAVFRKHAEKEQIARDHWPDRGAFGEPAGGVGGHREGNDGTLLFRPAPPSDGAGTFHDLIGNVAEYVLEKPDAFARWTKKDTAEDVERFLNDTPDAVAVIGGSALSAPEMPPDKAMGLPGARGGDRLFSEVDRGFSDVGFRLAFTAPARTHAERLKWVLAGETYVFPRTAAAAAAAAGGAR